MQWPRIVIRYLKKKKAGGRTCSTRYQDLF